MRITFKESGGLAHFPGLAAPKTVDVDALPDEQQARIRALVESSRFFSLPARSAAPAGAADYRTCTIEIADDDRRHTVVVSDPLPPDLDRLVTLLRDVTRR